MRMGLYFDASKYKEDPRLHRTTTDPCSILYEPCPDVKQLSPGSSLEWTWDQVESVLYESELT